MAFSEFFATGWSTDWAVDEVVVSFAHFYRKTLINLRSSAAGAGFEFYDPEDSRKVDLIEKLAEIAEEVGILLTVCSQPHLVPPKRKERPLRGFETHIRCSRGNGAFSNTREQTWLRVCPVG
jgi:hypothetical protein